jgi:hypothetical protein
LNLRINLLFWFIILILKGDFKKEAERKIPTNRGRLLTYKAKGQRSQKSKGKRQKVKEKTFGFEL